MIDKTTKPAVIAGYMGKIKYQPIMQMTVKMVQVTFLLGLLLMSCWFGLDRNTPKHPVHRSNTEIVMIMQMIVV